MSEILLCRSEHGEIAKADPHRKRLGVALGAAGLGTGTAIGGTLGAAAARAGARHHADALYGAQDFSGVSRHYARASQLRRVARGSGRAALAGAAVGAAGTAYGLHDMKRRGVKIGKGILAAADDVPTAAAAVTGKSKMRKVPPQGSTAVTPAPTAVGQAPKPKPGFMAQVSQVGKSARRNAFGVEIH